MARYGTVQEEAAALEAVIAERFPNISPEVLAQFCSSTLHKVAAMYRTDIPRHQHHSSVKLVGYDADGRELGHQPLLIEREA